MKYDQKDSPLQETQTRIVKVIINVTIIIFNRVYCSISTNIKMETVNVSAETA